MARIDGKYEELRELAREGAETLLEVRAPDGSTLRLGWFDVSTPAARATFHKYRAALRAIAPAGLADVVARPGAYYSLWKPVEGMSLGEFLETPTRDEESVEALRELSRQLASHGYALQDAEILLEGGQPRIARLAPVDRTAEEIAALNAPLLDRISGGKVRRRRPVSNRPAPSVWGVIPGLVFLSIGLYLGVDAARTYLNPPVRSIPEVVGREAQAAADVLVDAGYRVTFADGESAGAKLGSVIGQTPREGTALPAGRLVTLTVNNPPPLTVPKLEELTLEQARAALAENRLGLGDVVRVDGGATGTPEGRVIAQQPEAGATIARGQRVRLLVSSGVRARQTWLPDLAGLTYEEARELVRKAGLVVANLRTQTSDAPENSVLSQDPKPYAKIDVGTPVTLTLARAPLAGPREAVPSLPLAPAPQQTEPEPPAEETPTDQPEGALPGGEDTAPLPPAAQEPEDTAGTPEAPTEDPSGEASRTIDLDYPFPADLPEGDVDIIVSDLDGERVVLAPQPSSIVAGTRAQGPVPVRGPATFIVRVNGEEITRFER